LFKRSGATKAWSALANCDMETGDQALGGKKREHQEERGKVGGRGAGGRKKKKNKRKRKPYWKGRGKNFHLCREREGLETASCYPT